MNTIGLLEGAKLLRLHPKTLSSRAAKGEIPGAKVGRAWAFIEEDLLAYLRGQYVVKVTCPSTNRRGPKSGGRASASPAGHDCVDRLGKLIAQRRNESMTSSKLRFGK